MGLEPIRLIGHRIPTPGASTGSAIIPNAREFAERHNVRKLDTLEQMGIMAPGMVGRRLNVPRVGDWIRKDKHGRW